MTENIKNILIWMERFGIWFIDNWLTIVSIVLSGLISLIISATYYNKGNRTNLQMTIMFPIIEILKVGYSIKNYNALCDLSKNYCVRYMNKNEKRLLTQLVSHYKEVSNYNIADMNANILFSYFEHVLKEHDINVTPVPIEYEGEIVYYDYPSDLHYLKNDIQRILNNYDLDFQPEECEEYIVSLFSHYCRKYYTDTHLPYFNDYSLDKILMQSEIKKNWEKKFEAMEKVKSQFLDLKIVKELIGEQKMLNQILSTDCEHNVQLY